MENVARLHAQTEQITEAVWAGMIYPEALAMLQERARTSGACPLDALFAAVGHARKTG